MTPRKIKRPRPSRGRLERARQSLAPTFEKAERWIEHDKCGQAIELLKPLLTSYDYVPELHYFLGYAYITCGLPFRAIRGYERAQALSGDPWYWQVLLSLYAQVDLPVHTLRAAEKVTPGEDVDPNLIRRLPEAMEMTREQLAEMAEMVGLPLKRAEKGFYDWEEGRIHTGCGDFSASVAANRRAIRVLGDWPPPNNNLAQALFHAGRPEEAIEIQKRVIAGYPDDIHALSNGIRFLVWTGREDEAQELWVQLKDLQPDHYDLRFAMAGAAAMLKKDERVRAWLSPVVGHRAGEDVNPGLIDEAKFRLAVAEANLGNRDAAMRHFRQLRSAFSFAHRYLDALKSGLPGLGWAQRYPYFDFGAFVPQDEFDSLVDLFSRWDTLDEADFDAQVAAFARRFPQVVIVAEKLIWEEMEPELGVTMLAAIDTPAARAALRRFGQSQAGHMDDRMMAMQHLMEVGEIPSDQPVRVWADGAWRDVLLRKFEIGPEELPYADEVIDLIDQALDALRADDDQEAERLLHRAIELEPQAKEAYNNLGAVYGGRDMYDEAIEMYRAALEIDPLYPYPRCNLALFLLDEDDAEAAAEMLKPLADASHFAPPEAAFYAYLQARIALEEGDFEAAEDSLHMALQVYPGYEPAESLLEHIEGMVWFDRRASSFWEEQRQRDRAKRAKLQAQITTADPPLAEALPHYTKNALTGMGRRVIPWGGWSAYRKAELVDEIVKVLTDRRWLERVVESLSYEERVALGEVLDQGGSMDWQAFDQAHDNDLDTSPYWDWHLPEEVMGHLRLHGLLVEATVDGTLLVTIPVELRPLLEDILSE